VSGLPLFLTPAGRAALVDAANTGTSGLLVSHIGVSAIGAGVVGGALQGEIKRLTTFAGQVVADDTIHVTIRDDSTAVYSLRAFALYLQDGTLLAWYAQPSVILEKSEQAMLLLSADLQFQSLNVTSLEFGDSNWTNPIATNTVFGVLRLATNEVALAGTSVVDAITPAGLFAVLNARFGIGAPSDFVKGLLNLATAALFRTAIGLGSASLRNEGTGNGLDADLLDGQHGAYYRDWANLTGKPAAFPPAAHGHAWGDLSGVPSTATRWPSFAEVTDKPATYTPSAHTHAAADVTAGIFDVARIPDLVMAKITGLAAALAALAPKASPQFSGNVGIGVAGNNPLDVSIPGVGRIMFWNRAGKNSIASVTAANDAFQPFDIDCTNLTRAGQQVWDASNFSPGSKSNVGHTHAWSDVNPVPRLGGVDGYCYNIADWNLATTVGWYMGSSAANAPDAEWWMGEVFAHNPEWLIQRVIKFASDAHVEFQRNRYGGNWGAWERIYNTQTALDGRYAVRAANNTFRDITCHRGNNSGAVFLNGDQTRYLFYTGTRYEMAGADLKIDAMMIAAKFARTSSARYKTDIREITPERALALLELVRWTEYRMKADGTYSVGAIAEELADGPLDFLVERNEQGQPESVNYDPLFALVGASMKGIAARVAALEARQ
jgi:hypothetical protein